MPEPDPDVPIPIAEPPPVAPGTRLLHIGAPKTGTTAVQAAVDALAPVVAEHGVQVPGTAHEQARAALSVLGRRLGWSQDPDSVSAAAWTDLSARIAGLPGTVFFSSEYLCEAEPESIERIVTDLTRDADGGEHDLHVVLTLRPLERILPSAWQQYLKSGHRHPYPQWLEAVLAEEPAAGVTPSFWRRHDQAAVVERWAGVVGAGRMTVVALPAGDPGALLRIFDGLLGLPVGTLAGAPQPGANRSMTAAEAELFRQVNVVLRRVRLPWADYAHLVRYGAILRTVESPAPPGAERLRTPAWARNRARELGGGYVKRIDALRGEGLRVIGDLDDLTGPPVPEGADRADEESAPAVVPVGTAAEALLGAVARSATGRTWFDDEDDRTPAGSAALAPTPWRPDTAPVNELTTAQIGGVLARRLRRGVERRARRVWAPDQRTGSDDG